MALKNVKIPEEEVAEFCRRHHILKLSLFGSVLRDDFGPESDVDVLVEFDPEHIVTFFTLFGMEEELTRILNLGDRKLEIRTPADLSKYFRQEVLKNAELVYEKR